MDSLLLLSARARRAVAGRRKRQEVRGHLEQRGAKANLGFAAGWARPDGLTPAPRRYDGHRGPGSAKQGEKGFRAIGILGSDVYDKLLILRALRPRFPDVVFFTNNLDAQSRSRRSGRQRTTSSWSLLLACGCTTAGREIFRPSATVTKPPRFSGRSWRRVNSRTSYLASGCTTAGREIFRPFSTVTKPPRFSGRSWRLANSRTS